MNDKVQKQLEDSLAEMERAQSGDLSGMLNFSWSGLVSGLLFGIIGMWLLGRGRKFGNFKLVAIAFALMFYPYVTRGPLADWGVGIALCGAAYYFWRR
jgi:hypothetical protein